MTAKSAREQLNCVAIIKYHSFSIRRLFWNDSVVQEKYPQAALTPLPVKVVLSPISNPYT